MQAAIVGGQRIPTLSEIREHVVKHAWNGKHFGPDDTNEEVFWGECEYASTALSEMLTGTGKNFHNVDWSFRVRGWYKGDLEGIKGTSRCDDHAYDEADPKHCHSWVEFRGKIIDPTWWVFANETPGIYVFDLDDPRYVRDPEA